MTTSAAGGEQPSGRERRRPAVIRDVARLAGVSHQTVSRVLNYSPRVRPETRERVLTAMAQLDYRANPVARALTTGRSRTLGVVAFDMSLFGPASTLAALERAARSSGYSVSMVGLESLERSAVVEAVERLRAIGVDGALVIAPHLPETTGLYDLPGDLPVVAVEGAPHGVSVVAVDQRQGAQLATRHLLELGHETVHHIAGPPGTDADLRITGWRDALDAAGARVPPLLRGDWGAESGFELARRLLERPNLTAVFVANDQMAVGVLRAFFEHGLAVPGDASVVGFDDVPEAGFFIPPLTTVRQDFDEMGRRSVHALVEAIEGRRRVETRVTIPTTLVTRASSGPPPHPRSAAV
jgi:DNA-binding LacI/PurR family transcriptional regulator